MGVCSLSALVPGRAARLTPDLFPYLTLFDRVRGRYTLACKRSEGAGFNHLREQLRRALVDQPASEARVTDVRFFEEPPYGAAPVVYLAVDGPGLLDLHRTLTGDFGAIEGIEGNDYVPHVTLAHGGSVTDARAVASQPLDPIEWIVSQLGIYDSSSRKTTTSTSLPV